MKSKLLLLILLISSVAYSQKEGQDFCKGDSTGDYFPLTIQKKKIYWYNTYYFETVGETKEVKGNKYIEFQQVWEDGTTDTLNLREYNGKILEYKDCCGESMRFDKALQANGSWEDSKGNTMTILSYDAKLITPYCIYKDLMSLKAEFEKVTYTFYYLKGYGYVGAKRDGKLISYVSPEW